MFISVSHLFDAVRVATPIASCGVNKELRFFCFLFVFVEEIPFCVELKMINFKEC